MSSKGTIFLTKDNEHWYQETSEPRYDKKKKFIGWDIYLEIDKKNLVDLDYDSTDGLTIAIRGDSELAKNIEMLRGQELKE